MTQPNFANRTLYHGDNLKFLRGINSGTVHLIATDPPFNKNKDFHATPDSLAAGARFADRWKWDVDVHPEWVDAIQDDWPGVWQVIEAARTASEDDMAAFLCWLGVRLLEMHRILRDDGSLYLHIDHTAHAWTKTLMDAIFGPKCFQNEVVWFYSGGGASKKRWARKHDIILYYTKSSKWTFNVDDVRQPHKWDKGQRRADGSKRDYSLGKLPDDVIELHGIMPWAKERTGYPTQKPLALYERIIKASSNAGDVVLDPFAGCATTPIAAERLGRQWIGMDIWQGAHQMVLDRLQSEGLATVGGDGGRLLTFGDVHYSTAPPIRSDDNEVASPPLKVKRRRLEPPGPRMTRDDMVSQLIEEYGSRCQGCDRVFDDPRYLELDHNTPRSDGGLNHISNRVLLCGPCNRVKSNTLTLSGLREHNRQMGWMA